MMFVVGVLVGVTFGVFIVSLLVAADDREDEPGYY